MSSVLNEKEPASNNPVVVIESPQEKKLLTKKYVIVGMTLFLKLALLLAGILVGMPVPREKCWNEGRTQDVTSYVTNNVVNYHVTNKDTEAWVITDLSRNIKTTKILKDGQSTCFLTPLKKGEATQPSEITKPDNTDIKPCFVDYEISEDPVTDISFLAKDAKDMCKGVSTYWMYPSCHDGPLADSGPTDKTNSLGKREAPFYVSFRTYYNGRYNPCINSCCKTVCACSITYTWFLVNGRMYCTWPYYRCCPGTS